MHEKVFSFVLVTGFLFSLSGMWFTMTGYTEDEDVLRVMSFNIRYNNPGDGVNAWPHRKEHVADMIGDQYKADLAGLQEAQRDQIDDLEGYLTDYAWFGVGREDGKDAGEFTPIFYRKDRFEVLENDTFWLSEQPEVPGSKSWDTAITRIVTWAKMKDKKTDKVFYYFNTHFDHRGREARLESAKLIWNKIKEIADELPVVLTGDFNVRESSEPYAILSGKQEYDGEKSQLKDARYVSKSDHEGPTSTSTNWKEHGEPETKIDYIFVHNGVEVLSHKTLNDKYGEYYPSDHLPVLAELKLP